jgi:7-keto-8-aminopelargonate synthetase-like enzyme
LAQFHVADAALLFSGYDANVGFGECTTKKGSHTMTNYVTNENLGIKLSNSKAYKLLTMILKELETLLKHKYSETVYVVESVFFYGW